MKRKKNFRKKPKDNSIGLSVTVFNNNIEGALKVLKRKVKDSNLFLELRKKEFYEKPSTTRRHKKQMAKLRGQYAQQKDEKNY